MKPLRILAALAAIALIGGSAMAAPKPEKDGRLYWLVGCWQSQDGVNRQEWTTSFSGVMFGHATSITGGQLTGYEQSRIELRRNSAVLSISRDGQRSIDFIEPPQQPAPPLAKGQKPPPPSVTFENPDSDYPQRIVYRSLGSKGVAAVISQLDGSRSAELVWIYCKK